MSNRTTINVDKENHRKANMVKEIHDESWSEVLEFYWKHRGFGYYYSKDPNPQPKQGMQEFDTTGVANELKDELSMANEPGVEVDVDGLFNRIDTLEGRIKDLHTELNTLREELR